LELRIVLLRQSQQAGNDPARIVEGEFLDQVGLSVGRELVDEFVSDAADQLVFPTRHGLLRERLRDQRTQPAVHWFVHTQHHALTEHWTECRDHARRRERRVVTQHLLGVLVAVHDEDRLTFFTGHGGHVEPLDRLLPPKPSQFRVRIPNIPGYRVVEGPEVLEVVE
jgi:hypothetical protein